MRSRLRVTLVLAVAAVALSACGGGSRADAPRATSTTTTAPPTTTTTATTVPPGDGRGRCVPETMPAVHDYLGLTLAAAEAKARTQKQLVRVAGVDGVCRLLTTDFSTARVDVELRRGVVVAAVIG